jgi:hypothetical protein
LVVGGFFLLSHYIDSKFAPEIRLLEKVFRACCFVFSSEGESVTRVVLGGGMALEDVSQMTV